MRVLFDAYWWRRGPQSNRGVLRDLVATWRTDFPDDDIALAVPSSDLAAVADEMGPEVRLVPLRLWPHGLSVLVELPWRLRGGWIALTNNFTPLFGRAAVYLQDVLFMGHPEWFTRAERAYFSLMPFSAPRAQVVFASSDDQAAEIARRIPRTRRVQAVGIGLSKQLLDAHPAQPDLAVERGQFLLAVGRLNVRKNLARVCQGAVRSGRLSVDLPLVIVGSAGGLTTEFPDEVRACIADGRIVLAGHLSDEELAWLYENAGLFLFLSLGEGFGLPPVEALAFGCNVLAGDIPVMREVLGHHADFVAPDDVDSIVRAVASADIGIADEPTRKLRQDHARTKYSWSSTVASMRKTMEIAG